MKVSISLSLNIFESLTYNYNGKPEDIYIGARVIVPVGNFLRIGWVISLNSDYTGRTKKIIGIIKSQWTPNNKTLKFVKNVSEKYLISEGFLLDYSLLSGYKSLKDIYFQTDKTIKPKKISEFNLKTISAFSEDFPLHFTLKNEPEIKKAEQRDIKSEFCKHYLFGKDRFNEYEKLIEESIKNNKSTLIIVQDRLSIETFKSIYPDIDILNSSQKTGKKKEIWLKYSNGENGIIIGGLSALFLQIENLSTIIYERGNTIFTNRGALNNENDLKAISVIKAETNKCPIYLGTPAIPLEYYRDNSENNIFDTDNIKPSLNIIRIKKKKKAIFSDIVQTVKNYSIENKKILIILNNKKSKNILYCEKCKKTVKCNNCQTYIQSEKKNFDYCPNCNYKLDGKCPVCGSETIVLSDISMSSLNTVLTENIGESGIINISANDIKDIETFKINIEQSDIVISTPFIINMFINNIFDSIIYFKPESNFDMNKHNTADSIRLTLFELKNIIKPNGNIDVFTLYNFHYVFKLINEEEALLEREIKYREWFYLPPFFSIYELTVKAKNIRELGKEMRKIFLQYKDEFNIREIKLLSRKKLRGNYKGILRLHTKSENILKTNLIKKRNINLKLFIP